MKPMRDISIKLIAITLIVVVGIHSLNSYFYTHRHLLDDGTIITHAHPFNKSTDANPFKTHTHTTEELTFLATLIYFLPAVTLSVLGVCLIKSTGYLSHFKQPICQYSLLAPSLRAPPAQ
jgi:hypothetical protein